MIANALRVGLRQLGRTLLLLTLLVAAVLDTFERREELLAEIDKTLDIGKHF